MSIVSIVAAIDERGGLGKENQLLWHLPADLQHFKTLTLGKPVIMGRKTYESIGRPLPGRLNIVLSRQALMIEGVCVVNSLEDAMRLVPDAPEIMVIGGADLFKQALLFADYVYLTIVHAQFDADVFFPPLVPAQWVCLEASKRLHDEKNSHDMTFSCYRKKLEGTNSAEK